VLLVFQLRFARLEARTVEITAIDDLDWLLDVIWSIFKVNPAIEMQMHLFLRATGGSSPDRLFDLAAKKLVDCSIPKKYLL